MDCAGSETGMVTCLRGKIGELDWLNSRQTAEAPAVVAPEPEVAPGTEPALETATAEPEPEEPVETATAEPLAEAPALPSLDLVSAAPDGTLVIAGTGEPGQDVEIYANGALFGTTKAEPTGDWAFVPDTPLPPGGTAITLTPPEQATEITPAMVVVIARSRDAEPRVIASTTGEVDDILASVPEADVAALPEPAVVESAEPETAVAAVEPEAVVPAIDPFTIVAEVPRVPEVPEIVAAPVEVASVPVAEPVPVEAPEIAEAPLEVAALPEPEHVPVAEPAAPEPSVVAEVPVVAVPVIEEPAAPETAVAAIDPFVVTPEVPALPLAETEPEVEIAAVEPVASTVPDITVAQIAPPTIDAAEIDGNDNFIAGGGEEGATVRLYVEDRFVGESRVEGGRWLVEAVAALTRPTQRVRAEMSRGGSDEVVATAEADFIVEFPEPVLLDGPVVLDAPLTHEIIEPRVAETVPVPELPSATDRARADVVAALANVRIIAPLVIAPEVVEPTVAASEPVEPAAVPAEPSEPVIAVAQGGELGRNDALSAIDDVVTVVTPELPVEVLAEPTVTGDIKLAPVAAPGASERARTEVALALETVRTVVPAAPADASAMEVAAVEEPEPEAPAAVSTEVEVTVAVTEPDGVATKERARLEVALALGDVRVIETPVPVVAVPEPEVAVSEPELVEPVPAEPEVAVVEEPAPLGPVAPVAAEPELAAVPEREPIEPAAAEPAADVAAVESSSIVEIPTIRVVPLDAEAERFASGKVIIRRGDTLWDIAERVYGAGWRYQRIYRANRDQIGRPGRIYPGQVFVIPPVYDDK